MYYYVYLETAGSGNRGTESWKDVPAGPLCGNDGRIEAL